MRLLIAEDERLIRERLKRIVGRSGLDLTLVAEAENGRQALELAIRHKAEVAIVDIEMPALSGLEFLAKARKAGLEIRAVILTGFAQFEYAKRAISLGVNDYLLKPIQETALVECLRRIVEKAGREQDAAAAVEGRTGLSRASCLLDLLDGEATPADARRVAERLEALGSCLRDEPLVVALIYTAARGTGALDALAARVRGTLEDLPRAEVLPDGTRRILLVANTDQRESVLRHFGPGAVEDLSACAGAAVTIGASRQHGGLADFPRCYHEALAALNTGLVNGGGALTLFDEIEESDADLELIRSMREKLLLNLRLGDRAAISAWLADAFARFREVRVGYPSLLLFLSEALIIARSFAAEIESFQLVGEQAEITARCLFEEKPDLVAIKGWLDDLFGRLVQASEGQRAARVAEAVPPMREFLDTHFRDPGLGVNAVSQHVGLSPSYAGSLFRRAVGVPIVEYITRLRIAEATRLLEAGATTVQAASEAVGYTDQYYFSRVFKKHVGISPSAYLRTRRGAGR